MQIGAYIYQVHIAGDWYVNFADAAAKVKPDGSLMYRYGKAARRCAICRPSAHFSTSNRRPAAGEPGARASGAVPRSPKFARRRRAIRWCARPGCRAYRWRPRGERTGTADGFYFAAQGGHNAESHNHNDVGNFVVYANGKPVHDRCRRGDLHGEDVQLQTL